MDNFNFKISLCMIVKDGAEFLENCLRSVQEFVSEIIIVDTGSHDNSVEIAEKFDARISHFQWNDDFSAARNKSLEKASGDWILSLDADEEFDNDSIAELIKLITENKYDAFYVNITSMKNNNGYESEIINSLPRLFRNKLGVHYCGRVHEQIIPSLKQVNAKIDVSDIKIKHYGYSSGQDTQHDKLHRNLRLLKMELKENPGQAFVLFHLGETYSLLNDSEQAIKAYHEALVSNDLPKYLIPTTLQNYANAMLKLNHYQVAIELVNKTIEIKEDLLMPYVVGALAFMKLSQPENAVKILEKLLKIINNNYVVNDVKYEMLPDMNFVYTILAQNYRNIGNESNAINYYEKAIENESHFSDTYTGLAELLFDNKKYLYALKNFQQAYQLGLRDKAIYVNLMKCYYELGNVKKAIEMIQPLVRNEKQIIVNERYKLLIKQAKLERR